MTTRRARAAGRGALLLLPLALVTACGTTVDTRSLTDPQAAPPGFDGGVHPSGGPSAAPSAAVTPGTGSGPVRDPTLGPPGTVPTTSVGGPATRGIPSAGRSGWGFTPKTIKIGFSLADDSINGALGSTGSNDASRPNEPAAVKAIVAYVNAHGGIAGRRVVPVLNSYGAQADGNTDVQMEAACQAFTQDNQVFAAYESSSSTVSTRLLADCLHRKNTILMLHTRTAWDDQDFAKYAPYVYAPGYLGTHRWDSVVDELVRLKYFDPGYKLGIITIDEPAAQRATQRVTQRLKTHGLTVTDTQTIESGSGYAWVGQSGSQASSLVLRFKGEGISHVFYVGTYTSASYFFPQAAESQGYHPRYAYTSVEVPEYTEANMPAAQMARAVGVGWMPVLDVAPSRDPKDNPTSELCRNIVRKAGVGMPDRIAEFQVLSMCEAVFFLRDALARVPELSPLGLRSAADALGSSYRSALTHGTSFGPRRYDGASHVRGLRYESACPCWRYVGPWRALP